MHWRDGNALTLLRNGAEYFPALLAAIDAARVEILLESYLYEADATGRLVSARLMRAARRGVKVSLLLDGFGARDLPAHLVRAFERAGIRLLLFRPEARSLLPSLQRQRLRRMHRKLAVIDGEIGFAGGINVIDDLNDPGAQVPRYDYAVRVLGPLVADLRAAMAIQWRHTCWTQLKKDWSHLPKHFPAPARQGEMAARLVRRDNLRHRRDIEHSYLAAIGQARHEIVLANAYFLPGLTLRRALLAAARRGVRVVIVLQGRIDQPLLHYATRVLYRPLLTAGVEIHEYVAGFMHAKVAVVDSHWLTVGSSNIDPFSLLTAREANVEARNLHLAAELRADLQMQIDTHSIAVSHTTLNTGPWWRRALPWLAYQLVRGLLGLTGYGRQEYRE